MFKSTVDWCETNYNVLDFVAEFWNSVSGVAIAISAIYFKANNKVKELNRVFWLLMLVSVGTILFHSTLLYEYQLLDEMPMLLIAMEYLEILINLNTFDTLKNRWTITLSRLRVYLVVFIPFTYILGTYVQIISFHATLKAYEITILYGMFNVSKCLNKDVYDKCFNTRSFSESQELIKTYIVYKKAMTHHIMLGSISYSVSITLWVIENLYCKYVEQIQLHAWWHILSSCGIYHLNMIVKYHILINRIGEKIK
jgi:hypothetical protein